MEHTKTSDRTAGDAIRISLGFALLWAVLAAVRPGTTFHLAPLLVAGLVPLVYRVQGGASRITAGRLAGVGVALAAVVSVLLGAAGFLDGPSLLPFGGAFVESLAGAAVGGLVGLGAAWWPHQVEAH